VGRVSREASVIRRVGNVYVHEEHRFGAGFLACVASMGTRWFVLIGDDGKSLDTFDVGGPYDSRNEASERAKSLASQQTRSAVL
jgi:hypothetical protein